MVVPRFGQGLCSVWHDDFEIQCLIAGPAESRMRYHQRPERWPVRMVMRISLNTSFRELEGIN